MMISALFQKRNNKMSVQGYHPKANTALLIGAAGSFLANVNGSMINVLLPTLSQSFQRGIGDVAILSLAFFLSQMLIIFVAGRLCDVKSTRLIFLWGFGLHVLSTLLCAFAPTLELLAVCRLVQGAATALITVTASVAILRSASPQKMGRALGTIALSASLGFIAGPLIGGFLLEFLHWRTIFAIICCLGVVPFCYTWFFYTHPARKRPFEVNLVSLMLSWLAIGSLFCGLITLTRLGIGHPIVWGAALLSCLCSFVFARRCLHESNPLLSIEVLRHFPLMAALVGSLCNAMFFAGLMFALPFYLKFVRGLSDHQMGLLLMAVAIAGLLGSYLGGKLTDRYGAKRGSLFIVLGGVPVLFVLTHIHETTPVIILVALLSWFGLYYVFYWTSCTTMIMSWAQRGEEGKLSAIRLLLPVLGNAIGVSVFALFFDNSTIPTVAKSAEILGYFRQAIWFGLVILAIQVICTFFAASVPPKPVIHPDVWKEEQYNDSFFSSDVWKK